MGIDLEVWLGVHQVKFKHMGWNWSGCMPVIVSPSGPVKT